MTNPAQHPPDRSHLTTEHRNPQTTRLHEMSVAQLVQAMRDADAQVIAAMAKAEAALTRLLEDAEPRFIAGGRLVYLGAGTSGRLGVLDASEAPPTFCVKPGRVVGLIAGGDDALRRSSESKEDDPAGAHAQLDALDLDDRDTVIGIAAGGTTPWVLGALAHAATVAPGSCRAMITCTPIDSPLGAEHLVVLETGPEVITGSTRMKAGTATKLALNTISTTLMIRSGRVYENLMVDVRATNAKLRDRAARIITELTGLSRDAAFDLLAAAGGSAKTAIVMNRCNVDQDEAELRLAEADGRLERVLN